MKPTIGVRIPATTANLGSGFDALGLALTLYNEVYFTEDDGAAVRVEIEGLGKESIPDGFADNMVGKAMVRAAAVNGGKLPKSGILHLVNRIPVARGLGSSSAALVGGIILGNVLTGNGMDRQTMLNLANEMEGHPDNVAPAFCGGLCMSVLDSGNPVTQRVPLGEELSFITVSPSLEVSTEQASAVLPHTLPYKDGVFNVSRVAFLVTAFMNKQYDNIRYGLEDRLHMPYRLPLIPGGERALQAAVEAGALGATVSGSGSTVIAFATDHEEDIRKAMETAFSDAGFTSAGHILKACNEGAKRI